MERHQTASYGWGLWLFFGLPLAGELTRWGLLEWLHDTENPSSDSFVTVLGYGLALVVIVNLALYPLVRRLGQPILSQFWLYSVAVAAVRLAAVTGHGLLEPGPIWGVLVSIAPPAIVLVWFARRASAISFRHSLVFICLAVVLDTPGALLPLEFLYPSLDSAPFTTVFIPLAVVHVIVRAIGVWSFVNYTILESSARNLLAVFCLFIVVGGLQLSVPYAFNDPYRDGISMLLTSLFGIGQWAVQFGVPVLIVYAVRVREPFHGKPTPVNGPPSPARA